MTEPFARERVLARELSERLGLGPGAVEELAYALAAYRDEVQAVSGDELALQARRELAPSTFLRGRKGRS
jgi:hypothetical protein